MNKNNLLKQKVGYSTQFRIFGVGGSRRSHIYLFIYLLIYVDKFKTQKKIQKAHNSAKVEFFNHDN